MLRKLMPIALFVALILAAVSVRAVEPYYFGTIKGIMPAGSEDGWGLGGNFDVGLPLSDRIILRGTYESNKVDNGTTYDNVYTGFTIMSGQLIPAARTGVYLTAEGGLSKISGMPVEGATLSSMGFFSKIGEATTLWLGFGYSEVANNGKLWSAIFALSIQAPFE